MSWHNSIQIDGFAMKSGRNRGSLIEIKKVFFFAEDSRNWNSQQSFIFRIYLEKVLLINFVLT